MPKIRKTLDNEESVLVDEPGDYTIEIGATEDHKSKTEGECVKIRGQVLAGKQQGRTVVAILSKAPQSAFRIRQLVAACGKNPDMIEDSDELVGCRVLVHMETETYQGEERLKVTRFSKLD